MFKKRVRYNEGINSRKRGLTVSVRKLHNFETTSAVSYWVINNFEANITMVRSILFYIKLMSALRVISITKFLKFQIFMERLMKNVFPIVDLYHQSKKTLCNTYCSQTRAKGSDKR